MSISPALRASARAAYRDALRATAVTFSGDSTLKTGALYSSKRYRALTETLPFYIAFKLKLRNDILPNVSTTDSKTFEEKISLTKEVAEVLRKNIVQARRVENPLTQEKWRTFTC